MFSFADTSIRKRFRRIPILETERLILRKIVLSDTSDMYEYSRDPETSKFLLWEPHPNLRYTRSHILYLQKAYAKGEFFDWGVVEKESGIFIGTCGFTEIYEKEKRAEIGYVLSPRFHRRGYAPEAVECILHYGFEELGLEKCSGRFMEENTASQKVLTRLGFQNDTTKHEDFFKRGKLQKILTYSLTKPEFEKKYRIT